MITIRFNQQTVTIDDRASLAEVLQHYHSGAQQFAVAVNRRFIPRTLYATTCLQAQDQIDIILPMQGG